MIVFLCYTDKYEEDNTALLERLDTANRHVSELTQSLATSTLSLKELTRVRSVCSFVV